MRTNCMIPSRVRRSTPAPGELRGVQLGVELLNLLLKVLELCPVRPVVLLSFLQQTKVP